MEGGTELRVNISNAVIFGLKEDLKLGGVEYNIALTIFFVPYILLEIPSNILLKHVRPQFWCKFLLCQNPYCIVVGEKVFRCCAVLIE